MARARKMLVGFKLYPVNKKSHNSALVAQAYTAPASYNCALVIRRAQTDFLLPASLQKSSFVNQYSKFLKKHTLINRGIAKSGCHRFEL